VPGVAHRQGEATVSSRVIPRKNTAMARAAIWVVGTMDAADVRARSPYAMSRGERQQVAPKRVEPHLDGPQKALRELQARHLVQELVRDRGAALGVIRKLGEIALQPVVHG
jgi:hypothetical protein